MGRLGVRCEGDVIELAQAKPLAVHGHAKVAEIDGLPRSLRDLVCGRSRGFALRRQIRHDDSADVRQSQRHRGGMEGVWELLFRIRKEITPTITEWKRELEKEWGKKASTQEEDKAKTMKASRSRC